MGVTAKVHLQRAGADADEVRRLIGALTNDLEGVFAAGDLAVTERAGTPNLSVDVAAGRAFVLGTESSRQGTYFLEESGDNIAIAAADPTNPRIDLIVARVYDSVYSGVVDDIVIEAVTGVADAVPTAPALPENSLLLATVAVGDGATEITNADITDTPPAVWSPGHRTVVFTSSGTFNKADYPWARSVRVRVVGGGGGGGGAAVTNGGEGATGGGGGGGGYAEKVVAVGDLDASTAVTVGAGGAGGVGAANGGAGGTSFFGGHCSATGGGIGGFATASVSSRGSLSGAGGIGSGGDVNCAGNGGTAGMVLDPAEGDSGAWGGAGGGSVLGGGTDNHRSGTITAPDGRAFGGGGAGNANTGQASAQTGGAGAAGVVIVDIYG